ncbi:MAG: DUF2914 domain-containing protein [Bdellovibrionales bacterium]|nr:DUF2914 domain-containing protein [Bdellovibrionales bacterium]
MDKNIQVLKSEQTLKNKLSDYHTRYAKFYPAIFFAAGFLFDIFTLSRVDDVFSIIQQAVYIFIIIQILKYKTFEQAGIWQPQPQIAKYWAYSTDALHFMLGSLLSVYTLFYFVSSSLATSFIFMFIIAILLVANELPSIQKQGLILKYALQSICIFSFLFILVPVALGFIGFVPFIISLTIGLAFSFAQFKGFEKLNLPNIDLKKNILMPPAIVATTLLTLYVFKLLPPIPLSIQYIGIYHQVEKVRTTDPKTSQVDTHYNLKYDRPAYKFWQNGAQDFVAEPGDKIHCFIRVFAPQNFKDKIVYHWLIRREDEWQTSDKVISDISGGRSAGFRSFTAKSNFEPGDWRVQIETTDGREIGRINFTVELEPNKNLVREFHADVY